jgi:predicted nucleic acid-binding protein
MILVDTSVWIEFFRKNSKIRIPNDLISNIAVCPPVLQEVLQGIKDDAVYERIKISMLNFTMLGIPMSLNYYFEASNIYRSGRRRGISIRSATDCLIAAIAIREKSQIWHQDRDFEKIAKFTELKIFKAN